MKLKQEKKNAKEVLNLAKPALYLFFSLNWFGPLLSRRHITITMVLEVILQ